MSNTFLQGGKIFSRGGFSPPVPPGYGPGQSTPLRYCTKTMLGQARGFGCCYRTGILPCEGNSISCWA